MCLKPLEKIHHRFILSIYSKIYVFIFLLLMIFSKLAPASEEYYVFDRINLERMKHLKYFGVNTPYWNPSEALVKKAFSDIKQFFDNDDQIRNSLKKYSLYKFQVFGYTNQFKKRIFVNALCNQNEALDKSVIFVLDGGACYWQAHWDVASKTVIKFSMNGEA